MVRARPRWPASCAGFPVAIRAEMVVRDPGNARLAASVGRNGLPTTMIAVLVLIAAPLVAALVPAPVARHRPSIPMGLANLVMRCLEKKPADRWQSAEELLARLDTLATPSGQVTQKLTYAKAKIPLIE